MAPPNIMTSGFLPLQLDDKISIPQFMTRYNPDNVPASKPVHTDTLTNKTITYGGLRDLAAKCAWGLQQKLGVKEGDIILVIVPNCTDFVILAHSVLWAGAVLSPLSIAATTKDIVHVLGLVRPKYIVTAATLLDRVEAAVESSGLYDPSSQPKLATVLGKVHHHPQFPDEIAGQSDQESIPPYDLGSKSAKETVAVIAYSSGTTGKMKGVQLSHYNLISNTWQMRVSLPTVIHANQREVFFPPYYHIYGIGVVMMMGMWVGMFTCAMPTFDFKTYLERIVLHKATTLRLVPPVAVLLVSSELATNYDLSSIHTIMIAAAPLKEVLQRQLKAKFPAASITQAYGMTECCPVITWQHPDDDHLVGSCGKLVAGTEVRLVNPDTGEDAGQGEPGELWVRGPQVMVGYINDPASTNGTFSGEWYRTGDILTRDTDGNFYVTDRLKELIKYKGFQVAPSELEDLLLQHPDVVDAAVCSVYDHQQATELPLAYVSLQPQYLGEEQHHKHSVLQEIRHWFDQKVAGYKKLRGGVHHLQELPKSPSGKILRKELPAKVKERRESKL
jgi:4-coumarate--CoA ligase